MQFCSRSSLRASSRVISNQNGDIGGVMGYRTSKNWSGGVSYEQLDGTLLQQVNLQYPWVCNATGSVVGGFVSLVLEHRFHQNASIFKFVMAEVDLDVPLESEENTESNCLALVKIKSLTPTIGPWWQMPLTHWWSWGRCIHLSICATKDEYQYTISISGRRRIE